MPINEFQNAIEAIKQLTPTEKKYLRGLLVSELGHAKQTERTIETKPIKRRIRRGKKRTMFIPNGTKRTTILKADRVLKSLEEIGQGTIKEVKQQIKVMGRDVGADDTIRGYLHYLCKTNPHVEMKREGLSHVFYIKKEKSGFFG
jgi:hypothetical protein